MHIAECRGLLPELLDSAAAGRITPVMAARIPLVEAAHARPSCSCEAETPARRCSSWAQRQISESGLSVMAAVDGLCTLPRPRDTIACGQ